MPTRLSPERLNATKRYKQDHAVCEVCGWPRHVHCHHLVPIQMGGTNDSENLISLCANHHADAHAGIVSGAYGTVSDGRFVATKEEVKNYLVSLGPLELNVLLRRRRLALERQWADFTDEERNERVVSALSDYASREREESKRVRATNAVLESEGRERDRLIGELIRRAATSEGEQMALLDYRRGRRPYVSTDVVQ